jgi:hypothetical protein
MGHFIGGQDPKWDHTSTCPGCGGIKMQAAKLCINCTPRRQVQKDESVMDNHHRFEAAVQAGWDERVLIRLRPRIPSWEQIAERCPEAVMKRHPELIIERWWNETEHAIT